MVFDSSCLVYSRQSHLLLEVFGRSERVWQVFGVGKLGHEPFVTLPRLFHGLFYPIFKVPEGMK